MAAGHRQRFFLAGAPRIVREQYQIKLFWKSCALVHFRLRFPPQMVKFHNEFIYGLFGATEMRESHPLLVYRIRRIWGRTIAGNSQDPRDAILIPGESPVPTCRETNLSPGRMHVKEQQKRPAPEPRFCGAHAREYLLPETQNG